MKFFYLILLLLPVSICFGQKFEKIWETEAVFSGPESVVYDAKRDKLYVSNFRKTGNKDATGTEFISRVSPDGQIIELKWIRGISEPLGMTIFNDQLYIVERKSVAVVDLKKGKIVDRLFINNCRIINDVAIGPDSTIYVSECDTKITYAIKNGKSTVFLNNDAAPYPNGLLFDNGKLLIASNGDSTLKAADPETGKVEILGQFPKGIIDGIQARESNYLVSFFEGRLFEVTPAGEVTEVLNTQTEKVNLADVVFIENKGILIAPSLDSNRLVAYRYK